MMASYGEEAYTFGGWVPVDGVAVGAGSVPGWVVGVDGGDPVDILRKVDENRDGYRDLNDNGLLRV